MLRGGGFGAQVLLHEGLGIAPHWRRHGRLSISFVHLKPALLLQQPKKVVRGKGAIKIMPYSCSPVWPQTMSKLSNCEGR